MLPFELSEYRTRLDKTKQRMETRGIEVLLATDPANMCYLTGYDGWSFYVHQMVILALDEEEPLWVGRGMDANAAKITSYLQHANIHAYPDDYVQSTIKHPMDYVADLVKEKGWSKRVIGVEMDNYYFTAACLESLKRNLPNAEIKDASALVNWVRVIKSPHELVYISQAALIAERAMRIGIDRIQPGIRQCDAAAAIYQALISGTEDFGGDYPGICPLLPTGVRTSTPHLTWTDKPFVRNETTILELAGCRLRYHSPMARTVHLGKPPAWLTHTAEVVAEGLNSTLTAMQSGAICEDVEAVWRQTVEKQGIVKDSRIGYSVGLNYPPDWGEHTLSLRPGDKTVLQTNMTLHLMLGIWQDDRGYEISECVRVTEAGGETFAHFPGKLFLKD